MLLSTTPSHEIDPIDILIFYGTDEIDSSKKQLEVLSQSSVEDSSVEMEKKMRSLELDFDRRVKEKESDHERNVKELIRQYETEKLKAEEKHQVHLILTCYLCARN